MCGSWWRSGEEKKRSQITPSSGSRYLCVSLQNRGVKGIKVATAAAAAKTATATKKLMKNEKNRLNWEKITSWLTKTTTIVKRKKRWSVGLSTQSTTFAVCVSVHLESRHRRRVELKTWSRVSLFSSQVFCFGQQNFIVPHNGFVSAVSGLKNGSSGHFGEIL